MSERGTETAIKLLATLDSASRAGDQMLIHTIKRTLETLPVEDVEHALTMTTNQTKDAGA